MAYNDLAREAWDYAKLARKETENAYHWLDEPMATRDPLVSEIGYKCEEKAWEYLGIAQDLRNHIIYLRQLDLMEKRQGRSLDYREYGLVYTTLPGHIKETQRLLHNRYLIEYNKK